MPVLGFGTLIPDAAATYVLPETRWKLDFDILIVRNDIGMSVRWARRSGRAYRWGIAREDIFVTTKLWNTNHRPERVEPAFEASLDRLGLDYLDLYLSHTPFAFQPGDEQDPRDAKGECHLR